ncbi:MAG: branched-chain amino acid ABC transporter substrate-binding protein [Arenicella sp.]
MKKFKLIMSAVVLVSSTMFIQAQAADTIKVAIAGPLTGPVTQYGEMQKIGGLQAIDDVNSAGGVLGKKLEAVLYDDVCEPKQAVTIANKIANDGIKFVLGHLCSGSTQPASEVYDDEQILMITAASTSPAITEQGFNLIFRTIGLDDQQGPTAAKFILDKVKPSNVAVIHDKQRYGQGVAVAVKDDLTKAGLKPVLFEGVNKDQKDFSALITKMKKAKVDFVYYGGYHPELGLILRQSRNLGFDADFMGPEGIGNKSISEVAGEASEGIYITLPADFSQSEANAKIVENIKAKKQDPSGPFVLTSYAAVQVLAEAMNATKSTDPVEVAAYMRKNSFETPIGPVGFNEKGDLTEFEFVVFEWHKDATKTRVK